MSQVHQGDSLIKNVSKEIKSLNKLSLLSLWTKKERNKFSL